MGASLPWPGIRVSWWTPRPALPYRYRRAPARPTKTGKTIGRESERLIVQLKPGNRPHGTRWREGCAGIMEPLEGSMGTPGPATISTKQQRIAELARQMPETALTSLARGRHQLRFAIPPVEAGRETSLARSPPMARERAGAAQRGAERGGLRRGGEREMWRDPDTTGSSRRLRATPPAR